MTNSYTEAISIIKRLKILGYDYITVTESNGLEIMKYTI